MNVFDRLRGDHRPTQRLAPAKHDRSPGASAPDADELGSDIVHHLANTEMAMVSHERGYDLLIPGHKPIRWPAPSNLRTVPRIYEETTTLVLSYLIERLGAPVLFDVGAGLGHFSRVAASHANGRARAYAFEMRRDRLEQLLANIARDSFRARIFPQHVGLTDSHKGEADVWYTSSILFETKPEVADFRERWRWLKFNFRSGLNRDFANTKILMTSLDHFARGIGLWPDIVKIDVDGYEGRVLAGAAETLSRRPFILLELHKDKKLRFGARRRDIANTLFNLGYRALFLTDHQDRLKCEVVAVESGDPLLERQETDLILFFHPAFQRKKATHP
jgi:FkbM family methyltransferase